MCIYFTSFKILPSTNLASNFDSDILYHILTIYRILESGLLLLEETYFKDHWVQLLILCLNPLCYVSLLGHLEIIYVYLWKIIIEI